MEEKENKQEATKLSYEQLNNIAIQLQNRAVQAEGKLASINFTAMRLGYLFTVLDKSSHFPSEFVQECVNEVMELLKLEDPKEEDTKE